MLAASEPSPGYPADASQPQSSPSPPAVAVVGIFSCILLCRGLIGLLSCPAALAGMSELAAEAVFRVLPLIGAALACTLDPRRCARSPEQQKPRGKLATCAPMLWAVCVGDVLSLCLQAASVPYRFSVWTLLVLLTASFVAWGWWAAKTGRVRRQGCCLSCFAPTLVLLLLAGLLFALTMVPCNELYPMGETGGVEGSNFGQNVRVYDDSGDCSATPTSIEELEAVLASAPAGRKFTLVGARHSWGKVVQGRCLISLANFKEISMLDNQTVRVGAGVRFGELQDFLHLEGATLANWGAVNVQTVVGALLTGTHGSGTPALHNTIHAMRVMHVNASGHVTTTRFSRETDPVAIAQWGMSMGSLGAVVDLDLRVVPSFNVELFGLSERIPVIKLADAPGFLKCSGLGGEAGCMSDFSYFPLVAPDVVIPSLATRTTDAATFVPQPPRWNDTNAHESPIFDSIQGLLADNYFLTSTGIYSLTSQGMQLLRIFGNTEEDVHIPAQRRVQDALLSLGRTRHEAVRHVEMELYIATEDAAEALSVVKESLEVPELNYMHTYIVFCRLITRDPPLPTPAQNFVHSPFYDRDTMSMSIFYYGTRVDSRYRLYCELLVRRLRERLSAEVRYHPGKFTPEAAPSNAAWREADRTWDPLGRFGSDYFAE